MCLITGNFFNKKEYSSDLYFQQEPEKTTDSDDLLSASQIYNEIVEPAAGNDNSCTEHSATDEIPPYKHELCKSRAVNFGDYRVSYEIQFHLNFNVLGNVFVFFSSAKFFSVTN